MNTQWKKQLEKLTLSMLIFVATVFVLGVVVLVVCTGLSLNPFRETTTSFLIAGFLGLVGLAAILVLVNVALNMSLIADEKVKDLAIGAKTTSLKIWAAIFTATVICIVCLIYIGTYSSKEQYLKIVRSQADAVLNENHDLLDEIGSRLASGTPKDFKRIFEIRRFLAEQRRDLPDLTIIYSDNFGTKPALYQINNFDTVDLEKNHYESRYYPCTENFDCEYLRNFFSGHPAEIMQKYKFRDDQQFCIYAPHVGKERRFILLFDRRNYYGKMGS